MSGQLIATWVTLGAVAGTAACSRRRKPAAVALFHIPQVARRRDSAEGDHDGRTLLSAGGGWLARGKTPRVRKVARRPPPGDRRALAAPDHAVAFSPPGEPVGAQELVDDGEGGPDRPGGVVQAGDVDTQVTGGQRKRQLKHGFPDPWQEQVTRP